MNAQNQENRWQPVHAAASHNDWPMLINLLRSGYAIDVRDEQGDPPLYVAARLGRLEAVRKLVQYGASLEAANDSGHTPLMAAVAAENLEVVRFLLGAHASIKASTPGTGQTVLHWSLAHPPKNPQAVAAIVRQLIAAGANVNEKSRDGATPLMQAAWFGSEPVLKRCWKAARIHAWRTQQAASPPSSRQSVATSPPRHSSKTSVPRLLGKEL